MELLLAFTRNLNKMLTDYADGMKVIPEECATTLKNISMFVTPPHPTICAYIKEKVGRFVGLMRWWRATQADAHSDRVTAGIVEDAAATASVTRRSEEERRQRFEKKKMAVITLVEKLVARLQKKAEVHYSSENLEKIIYRLFERVWAECPAQYDDHPRNASTCRQGSFQRLVPTLDL